MSEENTTKPLSSELDTAINGNPVSPTRSVETGLNPAHKKKKKNKKKQAKNHPRTTLSEGTGAPQETPIGEAEELLTPDNYSVPEALPAPVFNLPVKPDEWFIQPAIYDENDNLITEETFIFLRDGIEIISMPLNEDNFAGLSYLLHERFPTNDTNTEADFFHIRKPLSGSEEVDPVMTLTQGNKILATTVLDQKTLKRLIKALQTHVMEPRPVTAWLNRWWKKHKIWRVILIIAASPLALLFLYTIFWGATH